MKANELRIGNWVSHWGTPTEIKTGAQIDKNWHILQPIELTEEWLLKFGFEERINYFVKDFFLVETKPFKIVMENAWGEDVWLELQYVHQLQNLYFALTGKELEIKSPAQSLSS